MNRADDRVRQLLAGVRLVGAEQDDLRASEMFWMDGAAPIVLQIRNDATIRFARPVFLLTNPERDVIWEAIAGFNADYLRRGGYRLTLESGAVLALSQTRTLTELGAVGIAAYLEDFDSLGATCAWWCAELIERRAQSVQNFTD